MVPKISKTTGVVIVVIIIATFQLAVPATVMLAGPKPQTLDGEYRYRYGWQMFTESEVDVRYSITLHNGVSREVDPVREVGWFWGNVHYGRATLDRLCGRLPEALMITRSVTSAAGEAPQVDTHPCR